MFLVATMIKKKKQTLLWAQTCPSGSFRLFVLNIELREKIHFSVTWEIPRKINLIIQYLLTLLKAKYSQDVQKKKKKKGKVGYDNKQARDSKKIRKTVTWTFLLNWKKKSPMEEQVPQDKWGQYITSPTLLVKDLKLSFIWAHHFHWQLKSFHSECLLLKKFPSIKLWLDVNDTTWNRMRQSNFRIRLGLIKGISLSLAPV